MTEVTSAAPLAVPFDTVPVTGNWGGIAELEAAAAAWATVESVAVAAEASTAEHEPGARRARWERIE